MENPYTHIILFDGVCNLCNQSVQFVIKRDKKSRFKFSALQSSFGQKMLNNYELPKNDFNSFVYIKDYHCYTRSTAALKVAKDLGGWISILYIFIIVPKFIRDYIYDIIAKNRYRWFGERDSCMIPTAELKSKFID